MPWTVSDESSTSNDLLLRALDCSRFRDAEALFVRWVMQADLVAAADTVGELTERQARRAGHAVSTAVRAKLLRKSDADDFLRLLREKVGVADTPRLRLAWEPDLAFEPLRLKQRLEELRRKSSYPN
jgi:hypothetical protein